MVCPKCKKMNTDGSRFCADCGAPLGAASGQEGGQRLKGSLAGKRYGGSDSASEIHRDTSFDSDRGNGSFEFTGGLKGSLSKNHSGKKAADDVRYCKKCGRKIVDGREDCGYCSAAGGKKPKFNGIDSKVWIGIVSALTVIFLVVGIFATSSHSNRRATAPQITLGVSASPRVTATVNPTPQATPRSTPAPTVRPTPVPAPTVAPKSGPGPADIQGHDSRLIEPSSGAWLDEYDIRFVQSTGGVSIYLRWGPSTDYDYFDTVKEAEPVTVLAEQNGFSLVLASGNRLGWCKSSLIVSDSDQIAPVPSLNETYWTYQYGQTLGTTEACLFHSNGTYSAYSYSGADYAEGTYKISGRRMNLNGIRFIWNGSQFVSAEKYEMQVGWDYLTLSPDSSAYYEELKTMASGYGISGQIAPPQSSGVVNDQTDTLSDGEYYGYLTSWNAKTMTIELLDYIGRSVQSYNYVFQSTGQIWTLDISQSVVCLEWAWDNGNEIQCDSIDSALNTEIWDGTSTLREACTMQINFVVKDHAVKKIVFLYAA